MIFVLRKQFKLTQYPFYRLHSGLQSITIIITNIGIKIGVNITNGMVSPIPTWLINGQPMADDIKHV